MTQPFVYVNIPLENKTGPAMGLPRRPPGGEERIDMTVGIRHDDLRRRNRALVISAVRRSGQPSRTDIAGSSGLSHSTISAISADLIAEGVLIETKSAEMPAARRGRPQVALSLNPDAASVVSVVLSLNVVSASLMDYTGRVVAEQHLRLSTLTLPRDELVEAVISATRGVVEHATAGASPSRLTLAVQGITDSDATTLLWSPITPHSDVPFGDLLEAEFGLPVTVQNDCNMIAEALRWRTPERYKDDFYAILLSNGIGMGLMLRGRLFTGTHSSGGEFGHMVHIPDGALCRCGRRGCIEAYAGNYAVLRNARGGDPLDIPMADIGDEEMQALADAAREHDGPERAAFRAAGEAIGFGLGSLFALFDPAPVAIVGHGALAFDIVEPAIHEAIARTAGGRHAAAISFDTQPNEKPLIRDGSAMTALLLLDEDVFAAGGSVVESRKIA